LQNEIHPSARQTGFGDPYADDFDQLVGALFAIDVSGRETGSNP
jgi:hypothetical protein